MDNGGEAARPTTVESIGIGLGMMAIAVQEEGEAYMGTGIFDGVLGAPTARRASVEATAAAYHGYAEFTAASGGAVPVHREPGTGVAYAINVGASWAWQPGPADAVLVGLQELPGRADPVHVSYYFNSALQPRPDAAHGVGEVLVDLLRDGYYMWQPSPGTGRGEALPDGDGAGAGAVFGNFFAQQTLPGIRRAEGIAGALRGRNLGAGYDGSGALVDDLGAGYDNPGMDMVARHLRLRRLLPLAGIGACSVAVNGLAAGPSSPAVAFHLFVLLLAGLLLVILHVLRVRVRV